MTTTTNMTMTKKSIAGLQGASMEVQERGGDRRSHVNTLSVECTDVDGTGTLSLRETE